MRSQSLSRAVGLLLLVSVVTFLGQAVLLISEILSGEVVAKLQLTTGGVITIVLIAVGHRLGSTAEPPTSPEPETDAIA